MPKNISTDLLNHLKEPVVTLAVLVYIERTDGVILAFTSWDLPIIYNGNTYKPAIALNPSGVEINADLTTDQMDIIGAIDDDSITEEDIDAGRYDNAIVVVMRINPYHVEWLPIIELTGTIGQVDYGDGSFQAAINSLGSRLNQQTGNVITPVCRVKQLGDSQCKVDIASYQFDNTVTSVSTDNMTIIFSDSHNTDYFTYGKVIFKSEVGGGGLNHDLSMEIKHSELNVGGTTITVVLQEPMPFTISSGDNVTLEAGCDRRPITCRSKFSNLTNIHCEPYVPGNDYLLATGRSPS